MAEWRYYPDDCDDCGGELEVYTDQLEEGWVEDSDPVRCIECAAVGQMVVNDVEDVRIGWRKESEVDSAS